MDDLSNRDKAIELLQELGLKEYEAKCFVALSRLPKATAKEISEVSEVPRTRVYDAVRVLESKGLVEIQHSNPQVFRAVPIDEAADTLRSQYDDRTERLRATLRDVQPARIDDEAEVTHEVWSLTGENSVTARVHELIDDADREVFLIVGREEFLPDRLVDRLRQAQDNGVTVVIGTASEPFREDLNGRLPDADVFVSGLEWLTGPMDADESEIGRLVLVDRSTILVSTTDGDRGSPERAVFGRGFGNGLVVVFRRLLATGLLPVEDPAD